MINRLVEIINSHHCNITWFHSSGNSRKVCTLFPASGHAFSKFRYTFVYFWKETSSTIATVLCVHWLSSSAIIKYHRCHEKTFYVSKAKLCRGTKKLFPNGKFELKVDFGSVIMFNRSKIMICYLILIRVIKSNMIFVNFWHVGDFHWHKLTHGRFYRP